MILARKRILIDLSVSLKGRSTRARLLCATLHVRYSARQLEFFQEASSARKVFSFAGTNLRFT